MQAATYNYCGQVLFASINGVTRTLLLHCNTTYAVFFEQGLPLTSRTWVQLTNATINFINPYIIYTYNAIPWKIVGTVVAFDVAETKLTTCRSCTTFTPPVYPTATKTPTRTSTKQPATSTFGWYTLSPTLRSVTPTYSTSTPSQTYTRTVTKTLATPTPSIDLKLAQMRVDQKRGIIEKLSRVSIKTSLINIPIITRIDEGPSAALVNEIESLINTKKLTQAKLDAFHRLVLQEQAVESLLPIYADASAQIAKPMADTIKAFLGFSNVLKRAISLCKGEICVRVQTRLFDLMTKMLRNMITDSVKQFPGEALPKDTAAKIMDIAMRLVQAPLDRGRSLGDLFVDNSVEFAISGLFIDSFIGEMQNGINKGVNTVQAAPNRGFYRISGNADRAALMLNDLVEKATWADQSTQERYKNFSRASDLAGFAQDASSVFSIALFPPAVLINMVSRAERLAINAASIWGSLDDLNCVNYLGRRAVEMAFDSQVPGEDCKYRGQSSLPNASDHLASAPRSFEITPLQADFLQDVKEYKTNLANLVTAASSGKPQDFQQAITRFGSSEENITRQMQRFNTQAVATEEFNDFEVELLASDRRFMLANVAIYVYAADISTSSANNQQPQTNINNGAQSAIYALDDYIDSSERVDLRVPEGLALINLDHLAINRVNAGLVLEAQIANLGKVTSRDVWLVVGDGEKELTSLNVQEIPANQNTSLSKILPVSAGFRSLTITLWMGEEAVDSRVVLLTDPGSSVPLPTASPERTLTTTSIPVGPPSNAIAPTRTPQVVPPTSIFQGLCPAGSLVLILPFGIILIGFVNKKIWRTPK